MKSSLPQPINQSLLLQTSKKALLSPRKRMNHNFHQPQDVIQRFLNAIEPDSYIRPHQHVNPNREEIFLILKGSGGIIVFDHKGAVEDIHLLDVSMGFWGIDLPGGVYHAIVSIEPGSVFYEVKQGPYIPNTDKGFASWAPEEGSKEATAYLNHLKQLVINHRSTFQ
jgi:cupin fold WbuC family metalloprotein